MEQNLKPDCFRCRHFDGLHRDGWRCDAFRRIPVDVLSRKTRHDHAIEGDQGVRFEARSTQADAGYEPVGHDARTLCRDCVKFWSPDACRVVEGAISPLGWCSGWEGSPVARVDAAQKTVDTPMVEGQPLQAAGVMIVTADGKVLLLKRSDTGQWAFPGGGIEDGETAQDAALRECEEEIGLRPEIKSEWTRRLMDNVDFTTYLASVPAEFEPKLNDEHISYQWIDISELAKASIEHLGL